MKKLLSIILLTLLFFNACTSCYLSEKETLKFVKPIIQEVINYKEKNNMYPKYLTEIKKFPYKIKKYPNKNIYYFINRKDLYMEAYSLNKNQQFLIKIDFLKCNSSKSVHSVRIEFSPNGKYNIQYYKMPPAFKQ